jgi:hypothetical protein
VDGAAVDGATVDGATVDGATVDGAAVEGAAGLPVCVASSTLWSAASGTRSCSGPELTTTSTGLPCFTSVPAAGSCLTV